MNDEITLTITVHNEGWEKGSIDIDYGGPCPLSTDKEHLLERIKDILNDNLEISLWAKRKKI